VDNPSSADENAVLSLLLLLLLWLALLLLAEGALRGTLVVAPGAF